MQAPRPTRRRASPFSGGDVLGRSFSIWARNFVPFSLLSVLTHAPMLVFYWLVIEGHLTFETEASFNVVHSVLHVALALWLTAAVTYGVVRELQKQPATLGRAVSVGIGRMLPVLGTAVLLFACLFLSVLPGIVIVAMTRSAFLGLFVLILPLLLALLTLSVAVPVAVVERPGLFASLRRSAALTAGSKGSIFLVFLVLWIINWIANKVIEAAIRDVVSVWTIVAADFALQVLIGTLWAVACAVIYHDLRVSKEGVSVDELVSVFD
jgi:hypothetical protein